MTFSKLCYPMCIPLCFWSTILVNHLITVIKHVIGQKNPCEIVKISMWIGKIIIISDGNHDKKKICIGKVSIHLVLKFLINDDGFFNFFNFDTTMTYFWNSHFSLSLHGKHNVNISKVHYESIMFLKFIHDF